MLDADLFSPSRESRLWAQELEQMNFPYGCVSSTLEQLISSGLRRQFGCKGRPRGEDCESADEASPTISDIAVARRQAQGLLDAGFGLVAVLVFGEDAGTAS